jgi:MurNAc alpha-1-phosphate uridylyltransferase
MADSLAGTERQPIAGELAAVVLAAGAGTRLRPLTAVRPKALCPVANRPLVDLALDRAAPLTSALAVNLHHGRDQLESHLHRRGGVYLSIEEPEPVGTAGALGRLRPWIAGRAVLVQNADTWSTASLAPFVEGWDGERIRLLVVADPTGGARFGPGMGLVASLLPWSQVAALEAVPSGLFETMWAPAHAAGMVEVVAYPGSFVDCGTPRAYLRANVEAAALTAAGSVIDATAIVRAPIDRSVVGSGAVVDGPLQRCVLWDGAVVGPREQLADVIRTPGLTVAVR